MLSCRNEHAFFPGDFQVLSNRQGGENSAVVRNPAYSQIGNFVGRQMRNVYALKGNLTSSGRGQTEDTPQLGLTDRGKAGRAEYLPPSLLSQTWMIIS